MYIVRKYRIHLVATLQDRKARQRLTFLAVSKAHADKFIIFWQCTYIVYLLVTKILLLYGIFYSEETQMIDEIFERVETWLNFIIFN
jgi:dTDP-D-glucose 4,6-dehydratase